MLHDATYTSTPASALAHFGHQLEVGYDQLYFLIVIMEFYLVFPLVLALLRRTKGHHGLVIAATVAAQFAMTIGMHWKLLPPVMIAYGQENALCYVLYLIGGAVVAFHLSDVHDWVVRNAPLVVFLTVASAVFAEGVYFLARAGVTRALGYGSDPFQPSVIPFNVCVLGLRVPGRDVPGAALAVAADPGRGAHRLGQRVRHLPGADDLHHLAGRAGLDGLRRLGAVLGVAPADPGDRLLRQHRADRRAGPDAAGGAADRAQAAALADLAAAAGSARRPAGTRARAPWPGPPAP